MTANSEAIAFNERAENLPAAERVQLVRETIEVLQSLQALRPRAPALSAIWDALRGEPRGRRMSDAQVGADPLMGALAFVQFFLEGSNGLSLDDIAGDLIALLDEGVLAELEERLVAAEVAR